MINRPVIFDCDGTLVDSEALYAHAEATLLNEAGAAISEAEVRRRYTGVDRQTLLRRAEAEFSITLPAGFSNRIDQLFAQLCDEQLRPITGAREVVKALHDRGHPLAVASNSRYPQVKRSLEICQLDVFFRDRLATPDRGAVPKPAPDLYLLAAGMLGVRCEDCLAIDDTATGVKAARAAGAIVLGFAPDDHVHGPQSLLDAGAHRVIKTFAELESILAE